MTATQCTGMIMIFEKMFESRLFFVDKLIGMGARIVLCDPHRAVISGPATAKARHGRVARHPRRHGDAARRAGRRRASVIHNVGQIERGYERIDERLRALGAEIERAECPCAMRRRVVRAGHPPATQGSPFLPGPVFAARPYYAAGDPANAPYTYGRFHNPTFTAYEAGSC